jgi:1-acyl-sn-glycerol-3-phosphate acyltransferase
MLYLLYRALARLMLHLFFRRIEVEGRQNIPPLGPVLFVPNHTNALVDPLILMINMRRRLTITAKNVLARNPLLGWLMAALGVVTFHRREDVGKGADLRKNVKSLQRCREILASDGALCIFPEGISHSDPSLRPFHLGPARIAIDFVRSDGNPGGLKIVPVGLLYTEKDRFRSAVWLRFGMPMDAGRYLAEHPDADARSLTDEIRRRVEALTLNYATRRELAILVWTADIVVTGGAMPAPLGSPEQAAADWFRLLGRLQAGYRSLLESRGPEIADLTTRVRRYRSELKRAGIEPAEVYLPIHLWRALLFLIRELELVVVGLPLAAFGAVNHLLPYLIVRSIAGRLSTDKDHWASNVVYPSFAIFPFFYLIQLATAWMFLPTLWAVIYTLALPYTGYYAILYGDRWRRAFARARTFTRFLANRSWQEQLAREGREIIQEIRALGEHVAASQANERAEWSAPTFTPTVSDFESQFQTDGETLREIVSGLERLDGDVRQARPTAAARQRGYFTPDEDDRIRQLLLIYRNYRLALYEIIERYSTVEAVVPWTERIRGFMVGYAAALTLYAKSLHLIEAYENEPLVRKKLNEPDAKFALAQGFFDAVLRNYTSLFNYRLIRRAGRWWRQQEDAVRKSGLEADLLRRWLAELIRRQEEALRPTFWRLLLRRLHYDWRAIAKSIVKPIGGARYNLRAVVGDTFSNLRTTRDYRPAVQASTLDRLRPVLRPGDLLLMRSEHKITTALLPGFWVHAALYVGNRDELRQLGLSEHPTVRKAWPAIPKESRWGVVLEAISPRVTLTPLEKCLHVDHVAVLRPNLADAEGREALVEAFSHYGKPYDYEFDFNVTTRLVCSELVYRSWHRRSGISFSLTKRLGRFTLSCDDIMHWFVDAVEQGPAPAEIVALILQAADGEAYFMPPQEAVAMLRAIRQGLRPSVTFVPAILPTPQLEPKVSLP